MSPYRRGDQWYGRIPLRDGRYVVRKLDTTDKATAKQIEQMFESLKGKRLWKFTEAVVEQRLDAGTLWDAYDSNTLDQLEDRLQDVELSPYVAGWVAALRTELGEASTTPTRYPQKLRTLVAIDEHGAPVVRLMRSAFTPEGVRTWLDALPVSSAAKRAYHSAAASFARYLVTMRVLPRNPVREVPPPPAYKPRDQYLEHADVLRLVEAYDEPYRTIVAVIHGAGVEIGVACALTAADLDVPRRRVRARGTKNDARVRWAKVEAWAWAYVERHLKAIGVLAGTRVPLFPGINPDMVRYRHRVVRERVGLPGYHLHDGRHTYAVRAIRHGATPQVVAEQLGHADTQMAMKVYGQHKPTEKDYHWEQRAAAEDAAAPTESGAERAATVPATRRTGGSRK